MKKYLLYTAALAFTISAVSCDQKSTDGGAAQEISANEVINNPNTAEATGPDANMPLPVLTFEQQEHDFGTIKPGEVVKHTFKFKNTGNAPLLIESATATCGCTVPNWPKEPIQPGGTGEIDVEFDSKGKFGQQNKQITIRANTQPNITQVTIKGDIPMSQAAAPANGPVNQ